MLLFLMPPIKSQISSPELQAQSINQSCQYNTDAIVWLGSIVWWEKVKSECEQQLKSVKNRVKHLLLIPLPEANIQNGENVKQTRHTTEMNNRTYPSIEEKSPNKGTTTSIKREVTKQEKGWLETIHKTEQYFKLGILFKQRLLDEFHDDFIQFNHIKEIPPENLWYIHQYFNIHSLTEADLNNLFFILNKPLSIIKKSTENIRILHIPNEWDMFRQYSWELTKISDKEVDFLTNQINQNLIWRQQLEELLFPWTPRMSLVNILEALDELDIKSTVENIYHYRSTFCIPFSEQIPVNTNSWIYQPYSSWNPDMTQKYIQQLHTKDYPFLPRDVTDEMFLSGWCHEYKERIDPKVIIGSKMGWLRWESWIDNSLSLGPENGRDTYLYALKMIDKNKQILDSFQEDPVVLSKHQWPDGNAIYIITDNWNHRIAAAKIAWVPYVDVRVRHSKIRKQKEIISQEEKEEILKKVSAWLIEGKIEGNTLIINKLAFNEVLLSNDKLKTYISYYEKVHPNGFHSIYSELVKASVL